MSDSDSDVILIDSDDDDRVPSAQLSRNTQNSTSNAALASLAGQTTSSTAPSSASAARPSPSFAAFTSGQGSSAGPSRPPAPFGAAASAPVQKQAQITESKKSRLALGNSGLAHRFPRHDAPSGAASSSSASARPGDPSQSHSGPSTRSNQRPQTYTELLHAARGHAAPVKPVQGAPKAVWEKYQEELSMFRQDEEAILLQARTQQEEAEKKERKALQQIEAETVPGLHIRDLFWPDYEKLDKISQYSAILGEGPSMAVRAQAVRAVTLSSILPRKRRLDECIRYWDAHAASYNGCIEFSVEIRRPTGVDPNTGKEYSWTLTVCAGHVPLHYERGSNAWADYVIIKPAEGQEARLFEKPATAIQGAHVTVAAGTDNEHAALALHTPLLPETYAPVGRGAPATASSSASASASGMSNQPLLHHPIASTGRGRGGRGGRGGGIQAYWGGGRGGSSAAAASAPPRTPLEIDLLEGDLIIGIDDLDLRAVSGADGTPTSAKGSLASDSAASMVSAGTTGSDSSRVKHKSRAYEMCVSHLKTHSKVLLRVRRLTPDGRQSFFTTIMPDRPEWLHAVDESLLRQAVVRLLRGELIALKSFRTHGQQYMAYVAQRIETAIRHYQSAAITQRDEALQTTRKYSYPSAWRAAAYSTGTGLLSSSPSMVPAASAAPAAVGGTGTGTGRKRKRSLSSAQEEWGGDEGGWEAWDSACGEGKAWPCGCSALKAMSEIDPHGRPLNPHASPETPEALVHFIMHEADLLLYGVNAMPESTGVGSGVPVPVLLRRGYVAPEIEGEELQVVEDAERSSSTSHQVQSVVLPAASVHTGSVEEEEEQEEQDGRAWRGLQPAPAPLSSAGSSFIQANTSAAAAATTATGATEAQLDDTWATEPIMSQGGSVLQPRSGLPLQLQEAPGSPASTSDSAGLTASGATTEGLGVSAAKSTSSGTCASASGTAGGAAKGTSSGMWASASGSAGGGMASAAMQHHTNTSPPSQQVCDTCQLLDGRGSSCDGALPSCNHCSDDVAECTYAGVLGHELVGKTRGARAKGARAPRAPAPAAAVAAPTPTDEELAALDDHYFAEF